MVDHRFELMRLLWILGDQSQFKVHRAHTRHDVEEAARLRDEIRRMEAAELGLTAPGVPSSIADGYGFPAGTPGAPPKKRGKKYGRGR